LQTDEDGKRSAFSLSAPLESGHEPEQAFCCCTNGQAGEDVARPMSEEDDPR
jgi:hypothetical protein